LKVAGLRFRDRDARSVVVSCVNVAGIVEFPFSRSPSALLCRRAGQRLPGPCAARGLLNEGVVPKAGGAVPGVRRPSSRATLRGARIERRRFQFVMMATIIAGFWSLMSGTFFLMTLRAAGVLA
jgi:hypothetical protein